MKGLIAGLGVLMALGLLFFFYTAEKAGPPPEMAEAEIAQIEAGVLASMQTYVDGYREMDLEKVGSVTHPDFLTYPYSGSVQNRAEFVEGGLAWAEGKESWAISWVDTNVRVLSPDLAVFSGTSVDTLTYSDGRVIQYPSNAYAFLLERTADGWKLSVGGPSAAPGQAVEGE